MADEFKPVEGARRLEERIARDEDMAGVKDRLKAAEEEEQASTEAPVEASAEAPKKTKKKSAGPGDGEDGKSDT